MDSYTYVGLALIAVVAALMGLAYLRRRREIPHPAVPAPQATVHAQAHAAFAPLDHVRMVNDPSRSLGRRRDDGVGGES